MADPRPTRRPFWAGIGRTFLPFADAASDDLPLSRLLRLSLFQVSVGMTMVLLTGTMNRVMIVELGVPASLVAVMVSLPLLLAPARALMGHKSDRHRSVLGWRRGPYVWFGSLLQFGGLAIMPFALLILSGDGNAPPFAGHLGAALAFLLVGAGMHTVQTAGLALAADISPEEDRPRVVALLYVMLLLGMVISALLFALLLGDFTPVKLIQIIQGAAVAAIVLNVIALWKQEGRATADDDARDQAQSFTAALRGFTALPGARRLLVATGLGAAGFAMQDVLLEPYGGDVLGLSVQATTLLTALFAAGTLIGFALAGRALARGGEPHRLAGMGVLVGVAGFSAVVFAYPLSAPIVFFAGVGGIGIGGGLFSVCVLTCVIALARDVENGIALGAWGAVQATSVGIAVAVGGTLRDGIDALAMSGALGPAMTGPAAGYGAVYHLEILLLFASLVALGPLARHSSDLASRPKRGFSLATFPQ